MFWRKKNQIPLGVPLGELALLLRMGNVATKFEGSTLIVTDGAFTTRVEVTQPQGKSIDQPMQAVVQIKTELPPALAKQMYGRETECAASLNSLAVLGALTFDQSRAFVGSRLTLFEADNAWERLHCPLLLGTILSATPGLLGALRRTRGHEPPNASESLWGEENLRELQAMMSRLCFCTSSGRSFTAEFALEPGAVSAAAGDKTALFQLKADQPHPELGGGLLALLQLPHTFPSEEQVYVAAHRLNQLEMRPTDLAPHFGAWCAGHGGAQLAYVTFVPNELYSACVGIEANLTAWGMHRAMWAMHQLSTMGVRL